MDILKVHPDFGEKVELCCYFCPVSRLHSFPNDLLGETLLFCQLGDTTPRRRSALQSKTRKRNFNRRNEYLRLFWKRHNFSCFLFCEYLYLSMRMMMVVIFWVSINVKDTSARFTPQLPLNKIVWNPTTIEQLFDSLEQVDTIRKPYLGFQARKSTALNRLFCEVSKSF